MKQFMLKNWSDPEVLKKLELQSDAELQPDSIMQFLGSLKKNPLATFAGPAAALGGFAMVSITAGLCVIAAGYFAY